MLGTRGGSAAEVPNVGLAMVDEVQPVALKMSCAFRSYSRSR